jgi:hypothetical protein
LKPRTISKTLAEHYADRRRKYTVKFPNTYDADLRRLFSEEESATGITRQRRLPSTEQGRNQATRFTLDRRVSIHP